MTVNAAQVKSLFLSASVLADPAERARFLDQACAGDAELRSRVEALLQAHDAAPSASAGDLDATGDSGPEALPQTADYGDPTARIGTILGEKYKLIEEIGEGGMGSVYLAQQTQPVRRAVAVKVIKAGMDSKAVLARFEAERQALAMMDHPNIARVLDAGTTAGGRPYFVMELVKGLPITEYCDRHRLTPQQRLELFLPVCHAIQHAHQKGIIHRDIKPSNVLVALYDDRPVPKVIDFGVAKAAGQTLTDKTLMTGFGAVVGTAEYMSPEQASLNNLDIDTRSDVYSLGVLLYELLTGTTPVDRRSLGKAAILEVLRIVREDEVVRPSAKLSTIESLPNVAANRNTEPAKLCKLLKGELDWVVLKALEKDRTRRYETANGLARDIQRYLADEFVEARPPSTGYRLKKFVRRHMGQVLAASLLLFTLLAGMAGTTWGLFEAQRQARIARDETSEKEKARAAVAEQVKQRDAALIREAERSDELQHRLGVSNMVLAATAFDQYDVHLANERLEQVPREQRGWDWRFLKQQARGGAFTLFGHANSVKSVTFSPDGKRIASTSWNEHQPFEVKVWDLERGGALQCELPRIPFEHGVNTGSCTIAFSPDGKRIVTGGPNKTARVCDAQNGAIQLELKEHSHPVTCAAFSPDGSRIVTGTESPPQTVNMDGSISGEEGPGEVKVWDAQSGQLLFELLGHTGAITSVAFSPDGKRIATGAGGFRLPGEVKVWDAEQGGEALLNLADINSGDCSVAFSPDGTRLVTGRGDGTATIVDANTGATQLELRGHMREVNQAGLFSGWMGSGVLTAAFSPDGRRLVTGGGVNENGEATVWDAETGDVLLELKGHTGLVSSAAFSPDGMYIVTGSADATIKFWDARTGSGRYTLGMHRREILAMAYNPDGTQVALGGAESSTKLWDVRTATLLHELNASKGQVRSVSFSADGTRIVTAGGGGQKPGHATVWDAQTGKMLLELQGFREGVLSAAFSPDGQRLVTGGAQADWGGDGAEVKIWDARTGAVLMDLTEPRQQVTNASAQGWHVAFSPDGTRLVCGGGNSGKSIGNGIFMRDAQTGQLIWERISPQNAILSVAFSPDGKSIVTGGVKAAEIWDAETGAPHLALKGHQSAVLTAAFSSDGTRIVTGSYDRTVKIWDVRTGTMLVELKGHRSAVQSALFSPTGDQVVTGGGDADQRGEAFVWDAPRDTPWLQLAGHPDPVMSAAFNPDGRKLVSVSPSQGNVWDAITGTRQLELQGSPGEGVTHVAFSRDGTRIVTTKYDKTATVWDSQTGQQLSGVDVPDTLPDNRTSPDGRYFAHVQPSGLRIAPLAWDQDELDDRRLYTRRDIDGYREGYQTALADKHEFAARFYLNLIPPDEQRALAAQVAVDSTALPSRLVQNHLRMGRPDLALPHQLEVVELLKANLEAGHTDTLEALGLLGFVQWKLRNFDLAVLVFEELVKLREAKHGRDQLETLTAITNLGVNYRDAGRLPEALSLLEEAHRATKKYPELQWATFELLDAYSRQELGEVIKDLLALIAELRADHGEEHVITLIAMNNCGYFLTRNRQFVEAEVMLKDTIEREMRALGEGHFLLLNTRTNLGELYQLQEQYAQAEELLRRCLKEREQNVREQKELISFRLASTQSLLGRVLAEQQKFAEAETLLLAGFKGLTEHAGDTPHWGKYYLPDTRAWLKELYQDWGKLDEAKKWEAEPAP